MKEKRKRKNSEIPQSKITLSLIIIAPFVVFFGISTLVSFLIWNSLPWANTQSMQLEWCDRIYHQNVGCPEHGSVDIPLEVLIEQQTQYLNWCDRIYHQNIGCPENGDIEIPLEVIAEQETQHLAWCDRIYHQNIGCPENGSVDIPAEVIAEQEAQHLAWRDRIYHQNVEYHSYGQSDVKKDWAPYTVFSLFMFIAFLALAMALKIYKYEE